MMSLFKLKKLPRGCTLLQLKLNEPSFKKYLNQSLKKTRTGKESDLPFLIVDVKNLPDVTLLLFSVFALVYN